jgi:hypothetical protein
MVTERAESGALRARAYPAPWRLVAGALVAASRASLPAILALVLLSTDPPITPPVLVRLVAVLTLVPALAAWLVGKAFAAEVAVRADTLAVRRRDLGLEIPLRAIERIAPWAVPLPGPGVTLWMRSGRRLRDGLEVRDPTSLLAPLVDAGVEAARAAASHPAVVWAHAREDAAWRHWYQPLAKFVLFALLPAAVLFNAHQHIAYGGTLGEYHLYGLASYLGTFGLYWGTVSIYLVLYASTWRGLGEAAALVAARVAPSRTARVRRAVEIACGVAYYAGVPVLLVLRFLP